MQHELSGNIILKKKQMKRIIEILVDISGSMSWDFDDNEVDNIEDSKIEKTKQIIINDLIPTLDYNSIIRLSTFRAGKNCILKIKSIHKGEKTNKGELLEKVNKIGKVGGGTPIAEAINYTIERIKDQESIDKKIILLTDGDETCDGDFRKAAKNASELGINCRIYIVGIGILTEEASTNFEEIAEITDGGFFQIGNDEDTSVENLRTELKPLFNRITIDSAFNIIDAEYDLTKEQNLTLYTIFKDYRYDITIIPSNASNDCGSILLIEFYNLQSDINNLNESINKIESCNYVVEHVIIVCNSWSQEKEGIINKFCAIVKQLGVKSLHIKILGLESTKTNYIKTLMNSEDLSNDSIVVIGDGNIVNSNYISYSSNSSAKVIKTIENLINGIKSSNEITKEMQEKYFEQLSTLSKEAFKDKENRLPKSVLESIIKYGLDGLNAVGSIASIWSIASDSIKKYFGL